MSSISLGVLVAAASALAFGAGDFVGGSAARRGDPLRAATLVQGVGMVSLLIVAAVWGGALTMTALILGAAAGVGGGVGLAALYRALASGNMAVVTGLTGAIASLLALSADAALRGIVPSPIQLAGVACALGAAWIVTVGKGQPVAAGVIAATFVAGTAFALFFVLLGRAAESNPLWGVAAARVVGTAVLVSTSWVRGGVFPSGWRPLIGAGLLDAAANWLIVTALVLTPAGLATAVSNANTPIVTMSLAWLLLGERTSRGGLIALALACVGIALIALG